MRPEPPAPGRRSRIVDVSSFFSHSHCVFCLILESYIYNVTLLV